MKKLFKILAVLAAIVFVLVVAAGMVLRYMFPPERVKEMVTSYVKTNFDREVSFEDVSFRIIGVDLENFAISEKGTFKDGTFAKADSLVIKISLIPLLKKNIEIGTVGLVGFNANIIQNKDGSFNFSDLIPADESEVPPAPQTPEDIADKGMSFTVAMHDFYIKNSSILYKDLASKMEAQVKDVQVKITDFALDKAFEMDASFKITYEDPEMSFNIPVTTKAAVDLKNVNLDQATVSLTKFIANLNGTVFDLTSEISNFNNPKISLTLLINNLTQNIAKGIVSGLPNFTMPTIKTTAKIDTNLEKSSANVSEYKVSFGASALNGSAAANWGGKDVTYNVKAAFNLALAEIGQIAQELTGEYGLGGYAKGSISANQLMQVKGDLTLENVEAGYQKFIKVNDINGKINIASLENISMDALTGKINDSAFNSSFKITAPKKDTYKAVVNFDLDSLNIKELPKETQQAAAAADDSKTTSNPVQSTPSPIKLELDTYVKLGPITAPHFKSEGFLLSTKLTGLDATLKQTNGTVNFNLQNGAITDVNAFLESNKIVKVLFFSLGVIKRAFTVLKLDVLFPQKDENGNSVKKDYNSIPYQFINGEYAFKNGLMTLNDSTVSSDLTTVKATGNIDFPANKLNMKINTHLGKQGSSGFKPVVINVTGTMDDPKMGLDVLSTAASIVPGVFDLGKGTVSGTANTAGNVVKGTAEAAKEAVGGVLNLFKKKDKTEESK